MRRKFWRIAKVAVLLIAAAVVTEVVIYLWDESPPELGILALDRPEIPDAENGWTYLKRATDAMYRPADEAAKLSEAKGWNSEEHLAEKDKAERLLAVENGTQEWDAPVIEEVLRRNADSFALADKAITYPRWEFPLVTSCDVKFDDALETLKLARLMIIKSRELAKAGRDEEAMERAVKVAELGHAFESGKGTVLHWLLGVTIKEMGRGQVLRLAANTTVPPDRLLAVAKRLRAASDDSEGFVDALRQEYHIWALVVDDAVEARLVGASAQTVQETPDRGSGKHPCILFGWRLIVKRNQTKRFFVETLKPNAENASRPFLALPDAPDLKSKYGFNWRLRDVIWGNPFGRFIYRCQTLDVRPIQKLKSKSQTETAAIELLLVLKAYKLKTGRLPEKLDELVPEYLPNVPLDDFDGKPIRYSAAKKVVYSVGEDGKDDGGMTKAEALEAWKKGHPREEQEELYEGDRWDTPDPSWPIEQPPDLP